VKGKNVTSPKAAPIERADAYDIPAAQDRWLAAWDALDLYRAEGPRMSGRPRKYVLDMFPYPSGDLHMGHAEAFSIGDVVARFWMLRGYDVLHPIGWDSFGLPAENAAIKRDAHPAEWTYKNIDTQAASFRRFAISFDWSRRLHTSDPEYYRWTQWLFLRFMERGLAYRKSSAVNWCPHDQTVLANEQVVNGRCERCGHEVTKRELTQWYFKITDYADRLLEDMVPLEGKWSDRVLTMQRNWIGRSPGAHVDFKIGDRTVTVFTTRPDTLFGATFFVVAADAPLAAEICAPEQRAELDAYVEQVRKLSDIDRQTGDRPKTGVNLGVVAINPVNGDELPVYAADYVLADYGTGAIMAVPAHDQRDLEFARAFGLPVKAVVDTGEPDPAQTWIPTVGDGVLVNSDRFDGLTKADAIAAITADLEGRGLGRGAVNYRLRDWLLSRQRYWGCPIPVVHCSGCGIVAVPDDQLPVRLPDMRGEELHPKGVSPLAANRAWVETTCPSCGGPAERDTDTMDTFVDSSWYFLRYCSPNDDERPFDPDEVRKWMPVAQYIGGIEHAILHLLYSRFFTKVLFDMGLVDFTEPFEAMMNQGSVVNHGKAMSKSLGNGVDLGVELAQYGVDAVRLAMLFASPPEDDIDWATVSPGKHVDFLNRVWRTVHEGAQLPDGELQPELARIVAKTVDDSTRLVEAFRFNVAISRLHELTRALGKAAREGQSVRKGLETLAILLAPYAPFTAEECWSLLGHDVAAGDSVHAASWPVADEALLVEETVTCVVQIAGKVRDRLDVPPSIGEEELQALALASDAVQRSLDGRSVHKVIVRAPKLVNIVPG
jgi:leucyl-tRNA synthetase